MQPGGGGLVRTPAGPLHVPMLLLHCLEGRLVRQGTRLAFVHHQRNRWGCRE